MLGQFGPVAQRSFGRGLRAAAMYTVGMTAGAGAVGLALGALGLGVRWLFNLGYQTDAWWVLLAVSALGFVGGLRDLKFIRFALPQPARQVPRHYMTVFGPELTALFWGLGIGLAYSTMIQFSLYWVLAVWVALAGSPVIGLLALGLYGLVNGLLLIVDITVVGQGRWESGGVLGWGRTALFFNVGGAVLLACGVYLALRTVLPEGS